MPMRSNRIAAAALLAGALAALLAAAAAADEVHLTNGKSFQGVVANVEGDVVHIQMPFGGVITLPMSRVERIDRGESAFALYRTKKRDLEGRDDATVADWLELARWAHRQGFEQGYRDAALTAARLDPRAPEIAPALRTLGYAFDDRLEEWVPRDEAMARRGLVRFHDQWMTPEESAQRRREDEERAQASAERMRERRLDRITETIEAAAALELARSVAPPPVVVAAPSPYAVVYWPLLPMVSVPPAAVPPGAPGAPSPDRSSPPPAAANRGRFVFDNPFGGNLGPPELIPGRLNPDASPPPGRLGTAGG